MSWSIAISAAGTLVTAIFTVILLSRWLQYRREGKQRPHLLAWGVGLGFYCLGMFSQIVLAGQWDATFFRLWYWSGALMVAAWLGQGTIYLLMRKGNRARNLGLVLLVISVVSFFWVLVTPLDASVWEADTDMSALFSDILPAMRDFPAGSVRILAPVLNTWGAVALIGGALYSAYLFWRKSILPQRLVGNIFIAIGGFLPAFGGTLLLLGRPEYKYMAELGGAVLIFVGYLFATAPAPAREKAEAPRPAAT